MGRTKTHRRFAGAFIACLATGAVASCSGEATYRPPEAVRCAAGHGCGSALCGCADDVLVLAAQCSANACETAAETCERACVDHDGVASTASAPAKVAMPRCGQICDRLRASGCQTGCLPLFDECVLPEQTCDPDVVSLFDCIADEAVLSCEPAGVAISGCSPEPLAFCAAADPSATE